MNIACFQNMIIIRSQLLHSFTNTQNTRIRILRIAFYHFISQLRSKLYIFFMNILLAKVIYATCTDDCIKISFRRCFFYLFIITPQILKSITYDIPAYFSIIYEIVCKIYKLCIPFIKHFVKSSPVIHLISYSSVISGRQIYIKT